MIATPSFWQVPLIRQKKLFFSFEHVVQTWGEKKKYRFESESLKFCGDIDFTSAF